MCHKHNSAHKLPADWMTGEKLSERQMEGNKERLMTMYTPDNIYKCANTCSSCITHTHWQNTHQETILCPFKMCLFSLRGFIYHVRTQCVPPCEEFIDFESQIVLRAKVKRGQSGATRIPFQTFTIMHSTEGMLGPETKCKWQTDETLICRFWKVINTLDCGIGRNFTQGVKRKEFLRWACTHSSPLANFSLSCG